jgi:AbrB family looped-hinge helix DNA binding protein
MRATCLRQASFLTIVLSVRIEKAEFQERVVAEESTLTSKGQTTIPKGIRDKLGIKSGDRMTFTLMPDGTVLLRVKNRSVLELAGVLRRKGQKPVPIAQLSR